MNWLGRKDSNPRMSVPKTDALPLGDAPATLKRNVISIRAISSLFNTLVQKYFKKPIPVHAPPQKPLLTHKKTRLTRASFRSTSMNETSLFSSF